MTAANPNIDTLLRHQDWVRALARSLVADPSRAEDVAQQTMLEAITKAPRDLQRPKGWLAQVARNAARAFARSDRRRQAREHDVAKSDTVHADPADAAHRAQAHKSLVDSVFELPEPYHTVVLLRYFEDLKPQQIAKQLDRSVSTVRTQLQRGLAMMRDKLDRQFGDRGAWHAAVLPLFLPKQVAAGVPILTAIGSLAMWKLLMPVVALIAALLIGVEAMWAEVPPVPQPTGTGGAAVVVADKNDQQPNSQPTGREEVSGIADAPSKPLPPEHRLVARVVTPDGVPFVGLTLAYHDPKGPRLDGSRIAIGNLSIDLDQPAFREQLSTEAGVRRFARRFGKHARAVVALVSGQEVDRPRAVADASGRFSFEDPMVEEHLRAERDGFMVYGTGRSPVDGGLIYIVGPAVEVTGQTADDGGQALADVHVSMHFTVSSLPGYAQELEKGGFRSWQANSDAGGSFSLGLLPSHPSLSVSASKTGYESVVVPSTEIRGPVRWLLRRRADYVSQELTGIVRHADGTPAVKASVVYVGNHVLTDELGAFRVPRRGGAPNRSLVAYKDGYQLAVRPHFEAALAANPELADNLVLELGAATLSISGRVLDAAGEPMRNVLVLLTDGVQLGSSNEWIESRLGSQDKKGERTDRSGAFTLKGLNSRTYVIRAYDQKKCVVLESDPIQAGTKDVILRIAADAHRRLEGIVVDSHGNPIRDVTVGLTATSMLCGRSTFYVDLGEDVQTDAAGRFVLEQCPRHHAELFLSGSKIKSTGVKLAPGNQLMRVVAPRLHKMRVRVTSSLQADSFAALDAAGERVVTLCRKVGMNSNNYVHRVVRENGPAYELDDRCVELLLLKDKKEVGRVPLNLRANQLNTVDI